jgi:hypothetical protein
MRSGLRKGENCYDVQPSLRNAPLEQHQANTKLSPEAVNDADNQKSYQEHNPYSDHFGSRVPYA